MTTTHPALFIGHGSPMNAIQDNAFTQSLRHLGQKLIRPRAILCVSAHWMTRGTYITHQSHPKTIHDFGGFPQALFEVQYPAPGAPELAESITAQIPRIKLDDHEWGFDHGSWSVIRHMYPLADIPLMQLSLDMTQSPRYHFELGQELASLRDQGILIIASGNVVHNLRTIQWKSDATPYPWAVEFDQWVRDKLLARDFAALVDSPMKSEAGQLSIPTPEHYIPLLYILGAARPQDQLTFEFEQMQNASISMRSFSFN